MMSYFGQIAENAAYYYYVVSEGITFHNCLVSDVK